MKIYFFGRPEDSTAGSTRFGGIVNYDGNPAPPNIGDNITEYVFNSPTVGRSGGQVGGEIEYTRQFTVEELGIVMPTHEEWEGETPALALQGFFSYFANDAFPINSGTLDVITNGYRLYDSPFSDYDVITSFYHTGFTQIKNGDAYLTNKTDVDHCSYYFPDENRNLVIGNFEVREGVIVNASEESYDLNWDDNYQLIWDNFMGLDEGQPYPIQFPNAPFFKALVAYPQPLIGYTETGNLEPGTVDPAYNVISVSNVPASSKIPYYWGQWQDGDIPPGPTAKNLFGMKFPEPGQETYRWTIPPFDTPIKFQNYSFAVPGITRFKGK